MIAAPLIGCPNIVSGRCVGGQEIAAKSICD